MQHYGLPGDSNIMHKRHVRLIILHELRAIRSTGRVYVLRGGQRRSLGGAVKSKFNFRCKWNTDCSHPRRCLRDMLMYDERGNRGRRKRRRVGRRDGEIGGASEEKSLGGETVPSVWIIVTSQSSWGWTKFNQWFQHQECACVCVKRGF